MTTPAVRTDRAAMATPVPAPETPVRSSLGDLADAVPHLVWVAGEDGAIRAYNGRISAYGSAELDDGEGWRWELLVHPDDLESTAASWAAAIASGRTYEHEHRLRMADGSYRWHLSRGVRVDEPATGEVRWYGTATDVDTGRVAESLLRTSEERLRIAAEVANFGLYDLDFVNGDLYWSRELRAMLLWAADEPPVAGAIPIHPDDREATQALVAESRSPLGDGSFDHEYRVVRTDGSIRWLAVHGQTFFDRPEPDPERQPVRAVGVVSDVTERRGAEEIRDVFIGMLSHELRTPVTAIYGGSLLLRRPNLAETDRHEIVDDIVSESERLERLVENLLVLARAERHSVEGGKDPVLIRPLMERIVNDKRRRFSEATIVLETAADLAPARWDESSFELVLRNLISNALKYGAAGGRILVRAAMDHDEIAISVADDGPGLPEGEADRLFELFYRTADARRQAQGAGIGLFVVRALVESAGGRTWARNRPTGGAEFGFRLPRFVESDEAFEAD